MFAGEGWGRASVDSKVERGGDIRHAGEVYGLVALGTRDVDQKLFGNRVRDRVVIGHDRSVEGNGRETAWQRQRTEQRKEMNAGLHRS